MRRRANAVTRGVLVVNFMRSLGLIVIGVLLVLIAMIVVQPNFRLSESGWMLVFGAGLIVIARAARRRLTDRRHSG